MRECVETTAILKTLSFPQISMGSWAETMGGGVYIAAKYTWCASIGRVLGYCFPVLYRITELIGFVMIFLFQLTPLFSTNYHPINQLTKY